MSQSRFRQRLLVALVAGTLGSTGVVAAATYEQAMQAYERGNYTVALQSFNELADSGDADAMYMLGRLYARGTGVVQDYVQAHKWYNLAAAQGSSRAAEARDELARDMSQRQLAQAQRLARDWQPGTVASTTTGYDNKPLNRNEIRSLQQTLNDLGYDAGSPDGRMGGRTRAAIRQFQTDQELRVTGEPTRDVYDQVITASRGDRLASRDPQLDPRRDDRRSVQEVTLFSDSFRDGDYTRNPRWQVASGEFQVQNGALYSRHNVSQDVTQSLQQQQQQKRPEDLPLAILETLLQQATGPRTDNTTTTVTPELPFAEIYLPQPISNAFTLTMQVSSLASSGRLELGPYQGANRDSGYRLVYNPNDQRGIGLIRRTRSGFEIVETAGRPLNLEDGRSHQLVWSRDEGGNMTVSVDGATLLQTSDRTFRDDFSGFTLLNWGGEYVLDDITAQGPDL